MRPFLLVLGLTFAAVQSVTLVDCCCGSLCPHQDRRCTGCGDETECTLGQAPSPDKPSCCNSEAPSSQSTESEGCTHFNPSGETDLQPASADLHPPDGVFILLPDPETIPRPAIEHEDAHRRHRPPRPLYLRLHALLI